MKTKSLSNTIAAGLRKQRAEIRRQEKFNVAVNNALCHLDNARPTEAVAEMKKAKALCPVPDNLDNRKLLEKAIEEADIGSPEKAGHLLEMVLNPTGGSIAHAHSLAEKKTPVFTGEKMAGHTPGPWTTHNNIGRKSELGIVADAAPCIIALMHGAKLNEWPDIAHANARLIASAPDLLAALENARLVIRNIGGENHAFLGRPSAGGVDVTAQIEAAIAKARSEKL